MSTTVLPTPPLTPEQINAAILEAYMHTDWDNTFGNAVAPNFTKLAKLITFAAFEQAVDEAENTYSVARQTPLDAFQAALRNVLTA